MPIESFLKKTIMRSKLLVALTIILTVAAVGYVWLGGQHSLAASVVPNENKQSAIASTGEADISPQALQQIAALEAEKESRTPAQQKIDSRLLYRVKMERKEAIAQGVQTLESDLTVDSGGYIELEIVANVNPGLMGFLQKHGAEIERSLPEYRSITARLPILAVEDLAAQPGIIFIQPRQEFMTNKAEAPQPRIPNYQGMLNPFMEEIPVGASVNRYERVRKMLRAKLDSMIFTGTVTSEADTTHRANTARTLANVDGTGIKIGVLSNGVTSLAARQATGDLPANVTVLPGQAGSGDEGTAMLELVYDLAPGAQLFFATANPSPAAFGQNIRDLRTAGCDIIVDDVSYFIETPFQDGQAASIVSTSNGGLPTQAVNDITIGSQAGGLYFSSAANSGNKDDNTAGAWEGDFVDGGASGTPLPTGASLHNFGGGATFDTLTVAGRILLKWSDPLGASGNDYDLYSLNSTGTAVVASSTNIQSGTQDPVEDIGNRSAGERLVILRKSGSAARFLHLNTNRGVLAVSTAGVTYGHNAARNAVGVAATPAGPAVFQTVIGPYPSAHGSTNSVELFSSDGPRRIFYDASGTPFTPGDVSATGGQLLQKPDITAADGETTTTPGFIPFFGTSAAAPTAAAMMALVKQASPSSTRTQLYNAMTSSAIDIEGPGVDRDSGAGIFMPLRTMASLGVSGPVYIDRGPFTATEAPGDGDGKLEPGETGNLNVRLDNIGLQNATGVTATLSTSTSHVTVVSSATRSYPDLAAATGSGNSSSPFSFILDSSFPCGAPIAFTLTVNFNGGSSQVLNFTVTTDAVSNVSTTLDTTAPPSGTEYTAVTGTQTGRLNRNGVISNCASPKATPALQDSTVGRQYDAFTYVASAAGCVTVTMTPSNGTALYTAAYGNSYNPANIQANYLADWGVTTAGTQTFSFNVTAGQTFVVVVHEVTVGGGLGVNYTLNVSGPIASACSVPITGNFSVAGRVLTASGAPVANATVTITYPGGATRQVAKTGPFGFYRFDSIPAGNGYTLSAVAKGRTFASRPLNLTNDVSGFDLTASP